jgi:sugar/nucleoside kinase (ribokinase family)
VISAPASPGTRHCWGATGRSLTGSPAATTVLHLGSLACCVAPGAARILRTAGRQRSRGALVCLDPNVCPAVMGTPARGRLLVERAVTSADIIKASTDDISRQAPTTSRGCIRAERWKTWLSAGSASGLT